MKSKEKQVLSSDDRPSRTETDGYSLFDGKSRTLGVNSEKPKNTVEVLEKNFFDQLWMLNLEHCCMKILFQMFDVEMTQLVKARTENGRCSSKKLIVFEYQLDQSYEARFYSSECTIYLEGFVGYAWQSKIKLLRPKTQRTSFLTQWKKKNDEIHCQISINCIFLGWLMNQSCIHCSFNHFGAFEFLFYGKVRKHCPSTTVSYLTAFSHEMFNR